MSTKKSSKFLKAISQNYWTISTIFLSVVTIILAAALLTGGTTGAVSAEVAAQNVLDFAKAQGADATLVSSTDDGSLYEVVLSIEGQEVPVYVTKDGKTLVPQPISLEITEKTPTNSAPETTPTPTNIPKSNKPVVEAFVMSHCPYGTQIEKGLLPVVNALGDKIDFELKFVYYAMHPSYGEVEEQLNQYCIQKEQNDKFNDYLTCFLEAGNGAECLTETNIDKTALKTCTDATDKEFNVRANLADKSSWLSGQYPKFDIYKADNEKYQVGGSPTLVINGVKAQVGRDSISLLNAICSSFETAPEECNTKFEAASPSPGFGWSTTENANNAAACGA
ncbi:hypothetical protein J4226_00860 [Candidatus Pacearchaeota archaeon]|nr:hypothetical protein [Candidatus Pacearchaeota archaeon]